MNDFDFVVKVKVDPSNKEAISNLIAFSESVYGYERFECIDRLDLDTDDHYFGLLAFALCGDKAESWYCDDQFFVDNMDIDKEAGEATLYTRQNWTCNSFLDKIISQCEYDNVVIETYPNEVDESCLEEFGDYHYVVGKGPLYEETLSQKECGL